MDRVGRWTISEEKLSWPPTFYRYRHTLLKQTYYFSDCGREELFERRLRRVSAGSVRAAGERPRRASAAAATPFQQSSAGAKRGSLSWDTSGEGGGSLAVDPQLIGSVIEDLLKGKGSSITEDRNDAEEEGGADRPPPPAPRRRRWSAAGTTSATDSVQG